MKLDGLYSGWKVMAMFQITKLFQILNKGWDDVYLIFISLYIAQHHKHVLLHYRFWIFPLQNSESTLFSATVLIILAKSMERCSCIKNLFELEFTLQCILSIFSFGAIWKQNIWKGIHNLTSVSCILLVYHQWHAYSQFMHMYFCW